MPSSLIRIPPGFSRSEYLLGRPLRRSNEPDNFGFHPWSEFNIKEVTDNPFRVYRTVSNPELVDYAGGVTFYPAELAMRYKFKNPQTGEVKVIYVRDPQLRWTEIEAGVRSGVIPARYVKAVDEKGVFHGPMNDKWFRQICSQFTVSADNKLLCQGYEVCRDREDFEWKVEWILPPILGDGYLAFHHLESLVQLVRSHFKIWHLDSYKRAFDCLIHFNKPTSSSRIHRSISFTTNRVPPSRSSTPPPPYTNTPSLRSTLLNDAGQRFPIPSSAAIAAFLPRSSSSSLTSLSDSFSSLNISSVEDDDSMDSEVGI
ncbi:hypothetical protein EV360DRAFT_89729 [Lentinula raphanica]|nr:hypothetical protein EV360DRAFT_89729 [Lentinula raphanica]